MPQVSRRPDAARRLALAGFVATAVAFGPARIAFGQFLPIFRDDFALSTAVAGLIASGGFLGFLTALPLTAWLLSRVGQRVPVVAGASAAAAGFALIAVATDVLMLAAGIALAGASAGFSWTPFNDAADRVVPRHLHARALSAVATGTTFGVMGTGGLALAVGAGLLPWRTAFLVFVLVAVVAGILAVVGVPGGRKESAVPVADRPRLLGRAPMPVYAIALVYGATNATYLSFAADRVVAAGALPEVVQGFGSPLIFLCYGFFGVLGLATGFFESRIGMSPLLGLIFSAFAASLVLVALVPGSLPGVVVSAGLHGAAVMMISSVLSFWSLRIFPGRGSIGFTAALIVAAFGSVVGPATAGVLIGAAGPRDALLILAAPSILVAAVLVVRPVRGGA